MSALVYNLNPEAGTKQECPNCSSRFFDFNRPSPLTCPKCEFTFSAEAVYLRNRKIKLLKDDDSEEEADELADDDLIEEVDEEEDELVVADPEERAGVIDDVDPEILEDDTLLEETTDEDPIADAFLEDEFPNDDEDDADDEDDGIPKKK